MENEDILMINQNLIQLNRILEKENADLKAQISILFKLIENLNKPVYLTAPATIEPLPCEPAPYRPSWWVSPNPTCKQA